MNFEVFSIVTSVAVIILYLIVKYSKLSINIKDNIRIILLLGGMVVLIVGFLFNEIKFVEGFVIANFIHLAINSYQDE